MPEYVHEDGTREVTAPGSARDRELQAVLAAAPAVSEPDENNDPNDDPED